MDYLQFTTEMSKAWAWPVAAILIALFFRRQLAALLGKLQSLEAGGLKATFDADTKKLSAQTERAVEAQSAIGSPPHVVQEPKARYDGGAATADSLRRHWEVEQRQRPSAIILEAWHGVEAAVLDLLNAVDPGPATHEPSEWIMRLQQKGYLAAETVDLLLRLLSLKSSVAVIPGFEPDHAAAAEYERSATKVRHLLVQALERFHELSPRD